jgi:hypothetical protein
MAWGAIGLSTGLVVSAVPAQASPLRGAQAAAWWAAWNLRHDAGWTSGGAVSAKAGARASAATSYQAVWSQAARAVLTPGSAWDRYFARALATHEMRVKSPGAVGVLALTEAATGGLPQTALVQYLEWRRSLNPARFDFYHPGLGPLLQPQVVTPPQLGGEKITPPPPSNPPVNPPENPPENPPVLPPDVPPPSVPEPSSLAVAAAMLAAGAWARRRNLAGGFGRIVAEPEDSCRD